MTDKIKRFKDLLNAYEQVGILYSDERFVIDIFNDLEEETADEVFEKNFIDINELNDLLEANDFEKI